MDEVLTYEYYGSLNAALNGHSVKTPIPTRLASFILEFAGESPLVSKLKIVSSTPNTVFRPKEVNWEAFAAHIFPSNVTLGYSVRITSEWERGKRQEELPDGFLIYEKLVLAGEHDAIHNLGNALNSAIRRTCDYFL